MRSCRGDAERDALTSKDVLLRVHAVRDDDLEEAGELDDAGAPRVDERHEGVREGGARVADILHELVVVYLPHHAAET